MIRNVFLAAVLLAVLLSACGGGEGGDAGQRPAPDTAQAEEGPVLVTEEEAYDKAIAYYPQGVELQYRQLERIIPDPDDPAEQLCHRFDVLYNDAVVSGVAVDVQDGSVWFADMLSPAYWLSDEFIGYPGEESEVPREPVIHATDVHRGDTGRMSIYFANINTVPELSDRNEGGVFWNEEAQVLQVRATKATGSVTGAVDGPHIRFTVSWESGGPVLEEAEFRPAPVYSHPHQVLGSGEVLEIDSERLIAIAVYFRELAIGMSAGDGAERHG